jgi:hypothetical protein
LLVVDCAAVTARSVGLAAPTGEVDRRGLSRCKEKSSDKNARISTSLQFHDDLQIASRRPVPPGLSFLKKMKQALGKNSACLDTNCCGLF